MAKPKLVSHPRTIHRALHLQQHHHTGRFLHHRHTSYRSLAILLILAGIFMAGLNALARVTAETINVNAAVMAAIPIEPATLNTPVGGTTVSKSNIFISGACPDMSVRGSVVILVNNKVVGSAPCETDNSFSLSIPLVPGPNVVVARIFTITHEAGPDSDPLIITYIIPSPVTTSEQNLANEENHSTPLNVTVDVPFIIFGPEKDAVWRGSITGGRLPYTVKINWGDGTVNSYKLEQEGQHDFSHRYTAMEPHHIIVQVTDKDGRSIVQEYAAVTPYRTPITSTLYDNPTSPHFGGSGPIGIYGLYLVTLACFGYAWLRVGRLHHFAYAKVPASSNTRHHITTRSHTRRRGH